MDPNATFIGLMIVANSAAVYFGPSIIAHARGQRDLASIFALNLLLGWTVLGWIVALVWALKVNR